MSALQVNRLSKTYILKSGAQKNFRALKDVSFSINEGESVGIIGRNGAGKSTLLKLLSGITFPTSGEAKIEGTFSSLLEVGTGFHPDLSGRDNIFLNASILGVSKRETNNQLDEIIAFSGVEKFIDQPLKTYSSGMKLRLAFAVISHLKTDIIALDEVLAVGDSMFQVKCMERIFDFKQQGRTILFVSHNLSAVKQLCERSLVLEKGEIVFDGPTEKAIQHYLSLSPSENGSTTSELIKDLGIKSSQSECVLSLEVENIKTDSAIDLGVNISTQDGTSLYHFSNRFIDKPLIPKNGMLNVELNFNHQLKPGNYSVSIYLGQDEQQLAWLEGITKLVVPPFNPHGFHNPDAIQGQSLATFQ